MLRRLAAIRQLTEGHVQFDVTEIEKLRRDWLLLIGQVHKPASYGEAEVLRVAFRTWGEHFHGLVFEAMFDSLWDIAGKKVGWGVGDNYSEPLRAEMTKEVDYWKKKLGEACWGLHINARLPLDPPSEYASSAGRFANFQRDLPKWERKVRAEAQKAWRGLKDFVTWMGGESKALDIFVRTVENVEMEGFHVQLVGFDPGNPVHPTSVELFRRALREYRKRARRVFPWLLQHGLPMRYDFKVQLDFGGRYENGHVVIAAYSHRDKESVTTLVHTVAHEQGHHVYQQYLGQQQRDFWWKALHGDMEPVPVRELIHDMKRAGVDTLPDLQDRYKNDLHRWLRLDILISGYAGGGGRGKSLWSVADLEELISQGTVEIHLPKSPITGYAQKNPEEAFCEALGVLVAYGPGRLPAKIREFLHVMSPEIKSEAAPAPRLPALVEQLRRLTEMPHVEVDADSPVKGDSTHFGVVDFRIERYPLPKEQKDALVHAFHKTGFVARVEVHGNHGWIYFSPTGKVGVATPAQVKALPHLPDDWEKYLLNVD